MKNTPSKVVFHNTL